jgi:hypothetical protein
MNPTSSSTDLDLSIIEVKPGVKFAVSTLRSFLPDIETLLFFGKVYELNHSQLSMLLARVHGGQLVDVLTRGDHSTELQDYVIEIGQHVPGVEKGDVTFNPDVPHGEILPQLWESLEIQVAQSIKDVAAKLANTVGMLPGKQGSMVFKSMMVLNRKRPTIGDYKAAITHAPQKQNLVILDVSGSMTRNTIEQIVEDVVALSYQANAHMAVVSNTTTHWEPGNFDVHAVLAASEFGGTHYETLADLLQLEWGTVITIADYDSSRSAAEHLARSCTGTIDEVIDVSLVNRCTFLAECVGQFAGKVTPVMVAAGNLTGSGW